MALKGGKGLRNSGTTKKPGRSAGEVGTGGPGAFARSVTQDRDAGMSKPGKSGDFSPRMKTTSSER